MNNAYVDGLRQYDKRPRSPVVVPHDMSALRKKILFENTLLEERTLHEFSAGKGDGAGVDTGSAPLKPLTSLTPTPTPTQTPTPTPTPAAAGIAVASTASVVIAGNIYLNGVHTRVAQGTTIMLTYGGDPDTYVLNGGTYLYRRPNSVIEPTTYDNSILFPPNSVIKSGGGSGSAVAGTPFSTWTIGSLYYDSDYNEWILSLDFSSTNPSTDPTTIPTTGWTGYYGSFTITAPAPSITPTVTPTRTLTPTPTRTPTPTPSAAAPSGIPLTQTNISLTGFSYTPVANPENPFSLISRSAVLTKDSNTFWYSDYSNPNNPTGYDILLEFSAGAWRIAVRWFDPDFIEIAATNPAPNTSIPVTGWVLEAGAGNSGSVSITAYTFPDTATTNVVNALINDTNAETTSYLQSVGFTAVGGVFSIPLTKQVPPSQNYLSVEYMATFNDGAQCYLIHSTAANNRWFFVMQRFTYYDEEFGNQYATQISATTTTGQSNSQIIATRSSYSSSNTTLTNLVSPNCFS